VSLTVTCTSCRDPQNPRRIVSYPQNCRDCADDFVARHLAEFPDHTVEISGRISERPFDVPKSIRQLFEPRRTA
jgi:hypothetical protein